jgi:hypothetical protein
MLARLNATVGPVANRLSFTLDKCRHVFRPSGAGGVSKVATTITSCRQRDLNPQRRALETLALPIELCRRPASIACS